MLTRGFLALAAFALASCVSSPRVIEPGEPVTAITNVTLITEYGGERLEHRTVAVRGDRIIAIARDGRTIYYGARRQEADIWLAERLNRN